MGSVLGVLESAEYIMQQSTLVSVDEKKACQVADMLKIGQLPQLDDALIYIDPDEEKTANLVLAKTAIDFCFWGDNKWKVQYKGKIYGGSLGMIASIHRAIENGMPFWDPNFLEALTRERLAEVFEGENEIPLLDKRLENLQQVGRVLNEKYDGKFSNLIKKANKSAQELVLMVVKDFPCFNDITEYKGKPVRFYKRAQLLLTNLDRTFESKGLAEFKDFDELAALADYKIPQILRHFGVLVYAEGLAAKVEAKEQLAPGSVEEVEIRASMILAVEIMRKYLTEKGIKTNAEEIDYLIWFMKYQLPPDVKPHHRTRTIFY